MAEDVIVFRPGDVVRVVESPVARSTLRNAWIGCIGVVVSVDPLELHFIDLPEPLRGSSWRGYHWAPRWLRLLERYPPDLTDVQAVRRWLDAS